tara:strand:- start:41 stop:565 length:525 start_codon:yes stop_codon:yes gene_type:complete
MNNIIYEGNGRKVLDNGKTVIKIFDKKKHLNHVNDEWLEAYHGVHKRYGFVPKLHDFTNGTFIMEKIDGTPVTLLSETDFENDYFKIISKSFKILSSLYEYNINRSNWFWHCDTVTQNFMWDGEHLTLIDPESWFVLNDATAARWYVKPGKAPKHFFADQMLSNLSHEITRWAL